MTPDETDGSMKQSETTRMSDVDDSPHSFWYGLVVVAVLETVILAAIVGLVAFLWYVVL